MRSAAWLAIGVLLTVPTPPAETAPPSLKERAAAMKPFLPAPPSGWSMVEEETIGEDSAMSGSTLSVRRRYKKGASAEEMVEIVIGVQPNGKPLYPARLIDDPAGAAKNLTQGVPFTIAEALGQKALTRTIRNPSRDRLEHTVVHKLPNNVSVHYWVWTLPVEAAAPFRKAIDYAKLGALKP